MVKRTLTTALLSLGLVAAAPSAAAFAMQGHATPHAVAKTYANGSGSGTGQNGGTCNGNGTGNANCNCNNNGNGVGGGVSGGTQCDVPEVPTPLGVPVVALTVLGGYIWVQRRRLTPQPVTPEIE